MNVAIISMRYFRQLIWRLWVRMNDLHAHRSFFIHSLIHSFLSLQETTTQRRFKPSHGQRRRTSKRCTIWKGGLSEVTATQREDHSMLMDPQPKRPFAA